MTFSYHDKSMDESSNPYSSPKPLNSEEQDSKLTDSREMGLAQNDPTLQETGDDLQAVSKFVFTIDHWAESRKRYKQQSALGRFSTWLYGLFVLFVFGMLVFIISGMVQTGIDEPSLITLGITILAAFLPFLAESYTLWLAKRTFLRSQFVNLDQEFLFCRDFILAKSSVGESKLSWEAFPKARIFSDGVILFQTAKAFLWIPDRSFTTPDGPSLFRTLTKEKLQTKTVS